jgi:hypothetical protein
MTRTATILVWCGRTLDAGIGHAHIIISPPTLPNFVLLGDFSSRSCGDQVRGEPGFGCALDRRICNITAREESIA